MKNLLKIGLTALLLSQVAITSLNAQEVEKIENAFVQTTYKTTKIEGVDIFYREAGSRKNPTLLLLHGFPTSSHMFRDLIPKLSDKYHVIAPDYPGYGNSSMPSVTEFEYTFDHMATIVEKLLRKLSITKYSMYVMDYGAPVGFRIAVANPQKIQSLIIQNGNAYDEGLNNNFWEPIKEYWVDRKAVNKGLDNAWWKNIKAAYKKPNMTNEEALSFLLTAGATKWQYTNGVQDVSKISPDTWNEDQRLDALENLVLNDLENFRTEFFQTIDTAILSSGNISRDSTLKAGEQLQNIILKDNKKQTVKRADVNNLNGEQAWYKNIQVEHPDTGFIYYIQGNEKSFKERAMFLLITQIISTNYYAQIRTDKQLGYIVFATNFNMLEVPGLAFIVQSPNTDGRTLFDETSLFLQQQVEKMKKLSDEDIKQYQSAVVSRLLKKDNTLYQRSSRNWQEIDNLNANFDTKDQLANLVNKLTQEDVQVFFSSLINQKGNSLLIYSSADEQTDKPAHDVLTRLETGATFDYFSNME